MASVLSTSSAYKTSHLHYFETGSERQETNGHPKYIPTSAIEADLIYTLRNYLEAARDHIGLTPPLELRVGMTQVYGYELAVETKWFMHPFAGKIFEPTFVHASLIESYDSEVGDLLLPFFRLMYDMAGEVRPEPSE
jgi:hypothetical protein